MRTGTALLPLHGGTVPRWLAERMQRLGRVIAEAIVLHYGRDELLRRLAHPHWFQSFGAVMGMDWHSSGITTSVLGALKRGLAPVSDELGVYVCGGRGAASRETPRELLEVGARTGVDGEALARTSRLVAKIDGAAVQDGYELYLHGFVVTREGRWTVVQQGMRAETRKARRYHWLCERVTSFVDSPHAAIDGEPNARAIVNLVDARADASRKAQLERLRDPGPLLDDVARVLSPRLDAAQSTALALPHLELPDRHDVRRDDVHVRRLGGALLAAAEAAPSTYEELLLTPGLGARTLFALALVADVVHGAPSRFRDPARFSLAHGGKDGHPYPVPTKIYDETIRVLRRAVERARLGRDDELVAVRALDAQARALEAHVEDVDFEAMVEHERARSRAELGGRTVFDGAPDDAAPDGAVDAAIDEAPRQAPSTPGQRSRARTNARPAPKEQLALFGRRRASPR